MISNKEIIPVVFITDDNYALPTAVAINSLIKNKKRKSKYKIFVLYSELSEDIKNSFKKYNSSNINIELIKPDNADFLLSIKDKREGDYVSSAVLFKFAIPKIFKDYEKVIYIDGDTLIMDDLSDLYNTNIKNVYVGVVKDVHPILSGAYKRLGLDTYFNAGVILYNIQKILQDGVDDYLNSDEVLKQTNKYFWFEQDTYNVTFNKNVKYLNPKYNFIIESWDRYGIKNSSNVFELTSNVGKLLYKKSVIYHLASKQKPWIYKDGLMRKTWEKYYKSSPFSFMPIGNEVYFKGKSKDKFIERIFSVKNSTNKKHKVITIFGLKIKIKNVKHIKNEKINILENKIDNINMQITELKELIKGKQW